jgi:hypothetical protein
MTKTILCCVAFASEYKTDVECAVHALRRHGFDVVRMPKERRKRLQIPGDDFLEATVGVGDIYRSPNEAKTEIDKIVYACGGETYEWGLREPGYAAFSNLD